MNFETPFYLQSPHLQTIWGNFFRKPAVLNCQRERVELPDGDFVDVDWSLDGERAVVIVMHGMGGSINSHYANGIVSRLIQKNWKVCFKHARGCSGVSNRRAKMSHGGYGDDLSYLVKCVKERYPTLPLFIVGYSLYGNMLLKWLSENNNVAGAVAVSVPFELGVCVDHIPKIYQPYFLKKLKLIYKKLTLETNINLDVELKNIKTIREYDAKITAKLHGFDDENDYYQQSSCRQYLSNITSTTLIIHAEDDPFVARQSIPQEKELSGTTKLLLTPHGGHVGFVGKQSGRIHYWSEDKIVEFVSAQLGD